MRSTEKRMSIRIIQPLSLTFQSLRDTSGVKCLTKIQILYENLSVYLPGLMSNVSDFVRRKFPELSDSRLPTSQKVISSLTRLQTIIIPTYSYSPIAKDRLHNPILDSTQSPTSNFQIRLALGPVTHTLTTFAPWSLY